MNNDLISRKALKDVLKTELANVPQPDTDADYYVGVKQGLKLAETIIDNAPTVEQRDNFDLGYIQGLEDGKKERPQGEWKVYGRQGGIPISDYCTNCKYEMRWYRNKYNYCPNCGAKMKGGAE